ncbi:MAG: hypothetical protein ACHQ6T_14105 [Myxococcota bacterium]
MVMLGDHYSQSLQNVRGEPKTLSREEHQALLGRRLEALESLQSWAAMLGPAPRESRGVFFVLERFHLNHRAAYEESCGWVEGAETRLGNLNAVCFLLTVSGAEIPTRLRLRARSGGKAPDELEIERASRDFLELQDRLRRAAVRALVPTVLVDTDDRDWDRCAGLILERLDEPVG